MDEFETLGDENVEHVEMPAVEPEPTPEPEPVPVRSLEDRRRVTIVTARALEFCGHSLADGDVLAEMDLRGNCDALSVLQILARGLAKVQE